MTAIAAAAGGDVPGRVMAPPGLPHLPANLGADREKCQHAF